VAEIMAPVWAGCGKVEIGGVVRVGNGADVKNVAAAFEADADWPSGAVRVMMAAGPVD
jgi:hypothetical protein